jgi:hypothetical protein
MEGSTPSDRPGAGGSGATPRAGGGLGRATSAVHGGAGAGGHTPYTGWVEWGRRSGYFYFLNRYFDFFNVLKCGAMSTSAKLLVIQPPQH